MMNCAQCNAEIPDGKQTCVWNLPYISFICPKCTEELDAAGETKDITAEIMAETEVSVAKNHANG